MDYKVRSRGKRSWEGFGKTLSWWREVIRLTNRVLSCLPWEDLAFVDDIESIKETLRRFREISRKIEEERRQYGKISDSSIGLIIKEHNLSLEEEKVASLIPWHDSKQRTKVLAAIEIAIELVEELLNTEPREAKIKCVRFEERLEWSSIEVYAWKIDDHGNVKILTAYIP